MQGADGGATTMAEAENNVPVDAWLVAVRPRLMRMAFSILQNEHDAEDTVQETLLEVWKAHRNREIRNVAAYAARSVWLNAKKRRSRNRGTIPLDEVIQTNSALEPAVLSGEDEALTCMELEQAILGLPPTQQAVIRLRYYGGLSFREIGLALRISMNTAASRCRYALSAMKNSLNQP